MACTLDTPLLDTSALFRYLTFIQVFAKGGVGKIIQRHTPTFMNP
jgi:hypothetical protein